MREIQSLMDIEHGNIVRLFDVVVGRRIDRIFLVMEYCEQVSLTWINRINIPTNYHKKFKDLASLLDNMKAPFTEPQVKCLLIQLLRGMAHLHSRYLIHRDIKVWM
jgi:cyclin-dependent kinase 10